MDGFEGWDIDCPERNTMWLLHKKRDGIASILKLLLAWLFCHLGSPVSSPLVPVGSVGGCSHCGGVVSLTGCPERHGAVVAYATFLSCFPRPLDVGVFGCRF